MHGSASPTTTITPPTPGVIQPPGYQPGAVVPNYLVFAILSTVLCCLPTGIVSIIYAAQVNTKVAAGDIAGATQASKNAKLWALISLGLGLLSIVSWGSLALLGVLGNLHR
ncbi:MAG: CD225/dispanin family protein [Acidobacteriota bacterium]|jgi:hypothetical protein